MIMFLEEWISKPFETAKSIMYFGKCQRYSLLCDRPMPAHAVALMHLCKLLRHR